MLINQLVEQTNTVRVPRPSYDEVNRLLAAALTYGVDDSVESTGMANSPAVTCGVTWEGKLTISVRAESVHHGVVVAPPLILSPAVCEVLHGP